jgi:predicted nuclease of predicted toxin-antitoxin system
MRFLADMGISPQTVAFLEGLGHETVHCIVVFRLRNMRPERVNRNLESIVSQHREWLEQGAIISVTEGRTRVRVLPIETSQ